MQKPKLLIIAFVMASIIYGLFFSVSNAQTSQEKRIFSRSSQSPSNDYFYNGSLKTRLKPMDDLLVIGYDGNDFHNYLRNFEIKSIDFINRFETTGIKILKLSFFTAQELHNLAQQLETLPNIKYFSFVFQEPRDENSSFFATQIYAQFKPNLETMIVQNTLQKLGLCQTKTAAWDKSFLFLKPCGENIDLVSLANSLYETGLVEISTPDFMHEVHVDPLEENKVNSSNFENSTTTLQMTDPWFIDNIHARQAWALLDQYQVHTPTIAVLDTGIETKHKDLVANMVGYGFDMVPNEYDGIDTNGEPTICDKEDEDPNNLNRHGTRVAGIIAANRNVTSTTDTTMGVTGNYVKILPIRIGFKVCVSDANPYHQWFFQDSWERAGIAKAVDNKVDVINISLGYFGSTSWPMDDAIDNAYKNNVVIVASSGNEGENRIYQPANIKSNQVIAVGAINSNNKRWSNPICRNGKPCGSNYGNELDIVAPGVDLATTDTANSFTSATGTSGSAPIVASVAALMRAVAPDLTPYQIQDILQRTANRQVGGYDYDYSDEKRGFVGWNKEMGYGVVDAYVAVHRVITQNLPSISFRVRLERVVGENHATEVAIGVFNIGLDEQGNPVLRSTDTMFTNINGNSTSNLRLKGITTGEYIVCAKPEYYLFRCKTVQLTSGQNTNIDFSDNDYVFIGGDMNQGGQDGVINATDFERHRQRWDSCMHQPIVTDYCAPLDIDRSGQVNTLDIAIMAHHNERGLTSITNPTEKLISQIWRPFIEGTLAPQFSSPSTAAGTASVRLYNCGDAPMVGGNTGVCVYIDLSQLVNGAGSSNLIIHYDPGVWQVIDDDPITSGIQVTPWPNVFPNSNRGIVDPIKGEINFGVFEDWSASTGLKGQGLLATIGFQCLAGTTRTAVWAEWRQGDTAGTVVSEYNTGNNILGSFQNYYPYIDGAPYRVMPTVSITLPQGSMIGTYTVPITVTATDPYNQVLSVTFRGYYENSWHLLGTDTNPVDGWVFQWDTSEIIDQSVTLLAEARIPGDVYGYKSRTVTLDRSKPTFVSHSAAPAKPAWPSVVHMTASASDNLSGVKKIEFYVNAAKDGSANGAWTLVGTVIGSSGSIDWSTAGFEKGLHRIAYAIEDNAGNWNRWEDSSLPVITYGVSTTYLPLINREDSKNRTIIIPSQIDDGEIIRINCATWEECQQSQTGDYAFTIYENATIASEYFNGKFHIKRLFLLFDTRNIPSNATISKIEIKIYIGNYNGFIGKIYVLPSTVNFPLSVQGFNSIIRNTLGLGLPEENSWLTLNLLPVTGIINNGGYTKFSLVSEFDYLQLAPWSEGNLIISMAENTPYSPKLTIFYSVP